MEEIKSQIDLLPLEQKVKVLQGLIMSFINTNIQKDIIGKN